MKPNCYDCKFRGTVPGDAHSVCMHPATGMKSGDLFEGVEALIDGRAQTGALKLGIKLNAHGIRNGWAFWPANYDPTWLESCNGFEKKEVKGEKAD